MNRFICIHGHFYQPPRENPWLEDIEIQDSAHPYHNWNERIAEECYAPNAASRVLTPSGRIQELVDNYRHISFNFGPTLLAWMERKAPATYRRILESDRLSALDRSGHGNALAQVYNHLIMPLASRRDKETQVVWGIHDFVWRFGRKPEGMWLAETAVDTETLEVLIENGVRFTILSPQQALMVRPARRTEDRLDASRPSPDWQDVSGGRVDPSRPYLWRGPSGATIAIFFYDAPISRAVAFEGALVNGEGFAQRLLKGFAEDRDDAQLVNIATDGESYGHHHRFGDMALAYALRQIKAEGGAALTNYGEFLERFPPSWEVQIREASSWSCPHGVERWRSNCGCRMGAHSHWTQEWRKPLRESLNALAEDVDKLFEEKGQAIFTDVWRARNAYAAVILVRGPESRERFWKSQGAAGLSEAQKVEGLKLLEMQRHRLLMFTSCAWFFDEISGLESITVLLSAARVLELAAFYPEGAAMEKRFVTGLGRAKSNVHEWGNGAVVYERFVRPVATTLARMAAHQAVKSLWEEVPGEGDAYCYRYKFAGRTMERRSEQALAVGRIYVASAITGEEYEAGYAVLHTGGHDFHCVLKPGMAADELDKAREELIDRFRNDPTTLPRALDKLFGSRAYGLQDLLLEERRRILSTVIEDILVRFEGTYRQVVEENRGLMAYLHSAGLPMPHAFRLALDSVLGRELHRTLKSFKENDEDAAILRHVHRETVFYGIPVNWAPAARLFEQRIAAHVRSFEVRPDPTVVQKILYLLNLAEELELDLSLWEAENHYFRLWSNGLKKSVTALPEAKDFALLADRLRLAV